MLLQEIDKMSRNKPTRSVRIKHRSGKPTIQTIARRQQARSSRKQRARNARKKLYQDERVKRNGNTNKKLAKRNKEHLAAIKEAVEELENNSHFDQDLENVAESTKVFHYLFFLYEQALRIQAWCIHEPFLSKFFRNNHPNIYYDYRGLVKERLSNANRDIETYLTTKYWLGGIKKTVAKANYNTYAAIQSALAILKTFPSSNIMIRLLDILNIASGLSYKYTFAAYEAKILACEVVSGVGKYQFGIRDGSICVKDINLYLYVKALTSAVLASRVAKATFEAIDAAFVIACNTLSYREFKKLHTALKDARLQAQVTSNTAVSAAQLGDKAAKTFNAHICTLLLSACTANQGLCHCSLSS